MNPLASLAETLGGIPVVSLFLSLGSAVLEVAGVGS